MREVLKLGAKMTATKHSCRRVDNGEYEYRGRIIYRRSDRRDAYNPWSIALTRLSFATLTDAKRHVDQREDSRDQGTS